MTPVPRNRYVWFFLLAILGLTVDLWSKSAVFGQLGYPGGRSAWTHGFFGDWGSVCFLTSINEGALWGMGQGYTWLFALLSIVAVAGVSVWLFVYRAANSLWLTIALGLIMAGTLGNLYDRLGWHESLVHLVGCSFLHSSGKEQGLPYRKSLQTFLGRSVEASVQSEISSPFGPLFP